MKSGDKAVGAPPGQRFMLHFTPVLSAWCTAGQSRGSAHVTHHQWWNPGEPLSEMNVPLPLSLLKWWSREAKWTQIGLIPPFPRWIHPLPLWPKYKVLLFLPILVSCLWIRVFPAEEKHVLMWGGSMRLYSMLVKLFPLFFSSCFLSCSGCWEYRS